MAQTPKLRTHTDFDLEHLEELQHVVDRVLLPNSFRKRQAMNMGVGVMAAVIGAVCAGLTGQLWVGVVFAVLGAVFFLWGVFLYRIAAWQASRVRCCLGEWSATSEKLTPNFFITAASSSISCRVASLVIASS